jgi:hypothetical protein
VLAPVLSRDPLVALVGLTPVVHEFLAALEHKDGERERRRTRGRERAGIPEATTPDRAALSGPISAGLDDLDPTCFTRREWTIQSNHF